MRYTSDSSKKLEQIKAISNAIKRLNLIQDELTDEHCPCSGENTQFKNVMHALNCIDVATKPEYTVDMQK